VSNESSDPVPFFSYDEVLDSDEDTAEIVDDFYSVEEQESDDEVVHLLRQMVEQQERQAELLSDISLQLGLAHRQRSVELANWKKANPLLARQCREAADALGKVQQEFLRKMTEEVEDVSENLVDSEYLMNEFVDRYGPRLAHLNGVLQMLSQLSSAPVVSPLDELE